MNSGFNLQQPNNTPPSQDRQAGIGSINVHEIHVLNNSAFR